MGASILVSAVFSTAFKSRLLAFSSVQEANGNDLAAALLPFAVLHKRPWWEVRCPPGSDNAPHAPAATPSTSEHHTHEEEEVFTPEHLLSLAIHSLQLLQATFAPYLLNSLKTDAQPLPPSPVVASFFGTSSTPVPTMPLSSSSPIPPQLQASVQQFLQSPHPMAPLLSLEFYANLLGLFELNNHSIDIQSPLEKYWRAAGNAQSQYI